MKGLAARGGPVGVDMIFSDMPSHKANKWRTKCEYAAAEKYNLQLRRCSWLDPIRNGRPVKIKSTCWGRSSGYSTSKTRHAGHCRDENWDCLSGLKMSMKADSIETEGVD